MPERKLSARFPTDLPAWQELQAHYRADMKSATIRSLFDSNPNRFNDFSMAAGDLFLDFSKNLLAEETLRLLVTLAGQTRVADAVQDMYTGALVNATERRAALHVALRADPPDDVGDDVTGVANVAQVLDQMEVFVSGVQSGAIRGHSGRRFTDVVNIGIGGSDLGVVMAARALRHYWHPGLNFHSVSNIDGTQLVDLFETLNPAQTLFVICSKTFTTQETMVNANMAAEWISSTVASEATGKHFAAASTNHEAMDIFGINPAYRFGFWDWVGGRYSVWSAVGLSLALMIGMDNFRAMLGGARTMDQHFQNAPLTDNMPVLLAMLAVWYNNFFGAQCQAVLPYDNRLDRFPAFLQQLQMESNGKRVRVDGRPVAVNTGQVIWGEAGNNAQHSFYQLLHQGTRFVPVDFIVPARSSGGRQANQDLAIANCLAQSEALMDGYTADAAKDDLVAGGMAEPDASFLALHKTHVGNKPSNTLIFEQLTPGVLGQLIALYEHKVFVESAIWGINPFDQWGVELGKRLATSMAKAVRSDSDYSDSNLSTKGQLAEIARRR